MNRIPLLSSAQGALKKLLVAPALLSLLLVGMGSVRADGLTATQRMGSIKTIQNWVNDLPGENTHTDMQSLLAKFRQYPDVYKNVGADGTSVFAQWSDGPIIVINVLPAVSGGTFSTPTPTPTSGPQPTPTPASSFNLSGSIQLANKTGVADVLLQITRNGTFVNGATTANDGTWTASQLAAGTYTVTPIKMGYNFAPATQNATISKANLTLSPFTASQTTTPTPNAKPNPTATPKATPTPKPGSTPIPIPTATPTPPPAGSLTISGRVTLNGKGFQGVLMVANSYHYPDSSAVVQTDANGNWSASGLKPDTYNVSPYLLGYDFTPIYQDFALSSGHTVMPTFTGAPSSIIPPPTKVAQRFEAGNGTEFLAALDNVLVSRAAPPASQLPVGKQMRILCSFPNTATYTQQLLAALREKRFDYQPASGDASLESLKHVQGDGLFYIDAHAGLVDLGTKKVPTCFVQTSTDVALNSLGDPVVLDDMNKERVVAMCNIVQVRDANNHPISKRIYTRYGIGPKFIHDYKWSFAHNSLVWMNACCSANAALRDALFAAGASVYGGWTESVHNFRSLDAGHWTLDRLLGANELRGMSGSFGPEISPQRAFPLDELIPVLKQKGLDHDTTNDGEAQLVFARSTKNGYFGLLAPSIEQMFADEAHNQLRLLGDFGSKPTDGGHVTVKGVETPVISWSPTEIKCALPAASMPNAAGDIIALADGRNSNAVPLSMWKGLITFEHQDMGSLKKSITMQWCFRGDIHPYRTSPGQNPTRTTAVSFASTQDSTSRGSYSAQGSFGETYKGNDYTSTSTVYWNGSGLLSVTTAPTMGLYNGLVDYENQKMQFSLQVRGAAYRQTTDFRDSKGVSKSTELSGLVTIPPDTAGNEQGTLMFSTDSRFNIEADSTAWKAANPEVLLYGQTKPHAQNRISWPDGLRCTSPPSLTPTKAQGR